MAEFPALPLWTDARQLALSLARDGWRTPNTYCRWYGRPSNKPAVYLLVAYEPSEFTRSFVGYVGMATKLANRLNGHEVLTKIRVAGFDPTVWFRPAKIEALRDAEKAYIRTFNPPWNVIGKTCGVARR